MSFSYLFSLKFAPLLLERGWGEAIKKAAIPVSRNYGFMASHHTTFN
jgi:hypothetical protein